ncbi:RES family NAD+ phosphorylase [Cellvibrio polysaccharolyticus]|uniref:RES domain-containing protein n=1 Tax=Cellvibrio polysaccharolyticus TaxID=2082724 RepID=A0A928V2D5_9GAMM|nr:RES family NAD+ phosphorylase [Cellvibrio polysaccharolyticus]MBE8717526.1 RES domain-containing protein [Cellvibrio polysaccharolyticus]
MVKVAEALPAIALETKECFRLVNTRFPPIALFDDVADAADFEALFALQALTNPRLQNEVGNLNRVAREEMPFGIRGCSYAVAPFTHVNPDGSRFSAGDFGVLYLADTADTAIKEVRHHQQLYWTAVEGLKYDRMLFRVLLCAFNAPALYDATTIAPDQPIYSATDYSASRILGSQLREQGYSGIQYHSVRNTGATCWGLFTPKVVTDIIPSALVEFVWQGDAMGEVNFLTQVKL